MKKRSSGNNGVRVKRFFTLSQTFTTRRAYDKKNL